MLLVVASCLAVYSCSSSRSAGKTSYQNVQTGDLYDLATALADAGDWQVMKIPVNMILKKPMSAKIGGTMTLVRGSEVRLSLRFLGMEVAAASITGDSLRAYLKVQKVYFAESLDKVLGGFPATIDNLQSLLLARIFELGKISPDLRGCSISLEDGDRNYVVTPPLVTSGAGYRFTAEVADNHLSSLEIFSSRKHKAGVTYDYPRNQEDGIPDKVAISGSLSGKSLEAEIDYSVSGIDRSASAPKTFEIPRGYSKVSSSALLKLLDSLK